MHDRARTIINSIFSKISSDSLKLADFFHLKIQKIVGKTKTEKVRHNRILVVLTYVCAFAYQSGNRFNFCVSFCWQRVYCVLTIRKPSIWFFDNNFICVDALVFHFSCVLAYNSHLEESLWWKLVQYTILETMWINKIICLECLPIFRTILNWFPFCHANAQVQFGDILNGHIESKSCMSESRNHRRSNFS